MLRRTVRRHEAVDDRRQVVAERGDRHLESVVDDVEDLAQQLVALRRAVAHCLELELLGDSVVAQLAEAEGRARVVGLLVDRQRSGLAGVVAVVRTALHATLYATLYAGCRGLSRMYESVIVFARSKFATGPMPVQTVP